MKFKLINCCNEIILILFWIQCNIFQYCKSEYYGEHGIVEISNQNLKTCCSTLFGYKHGKCEIESGTVQDFLENSVLELPTYLFLSHDTTSSGVNNNTNINSTRTSSVIQLKLKTGLPNCSHGSNIFSIPILDSGTNHTTTSIIYPVGRLDHTGSLLYNNHSYQPIEYCINGVHKNKMDVLLCNPECNEEKTCIRKCCKNGEHMKIGNNKLSCVSSNGKEWKPLLHHSANVPLTPDEQNNIQKHFIYSHPSLGWCQGEAFFMYEKDYPDNPKMPFHILKNGNVVYKAIGKWRQLPSESFCLEGVYPENETLFDENYQESVVFHCISETDITEEKQLTKNILEIYWMLAILSSIFVLITIFVYGLLWETQNIHGWTLLSFFTSLFFSYIFLACMYITELYYRQEVGSSLCWGIAVFLHFAYLSTFCWMTIVNFDLWSTFRNLRRHTNRTNKKLKQFAWYSLFAIGIPSLILGIAISLDVMSKADVTPFNVVVPEYGIQRCFLSPEKPSLVFLYGPISILLCLNLLFFLLTIMAMYQIKKISNMATINCSKSQTQSVNLFAKLFVVMGVTWIFEVITWSTHPTTIPWWYIAFDVVNICHGVLIFIIFVCKRSTIRSLEQKYPCFKKFMSFLSEFITSLKSRLFCCCSVNTLERSHTLETTSQELEERRRSNDTDVTTVGTGTP